jgi:uncharacterized membrane protein YhaH (DUF805 family)
MNWYFAALKKYADFEGRSRRTEFWMFTLISVIISILLLYFDGIIMPGSNIHVLNSL